MLRYLKEARTGGTESTEAEAATAKGAKAEVKEPEKLPINEMPNVHMPITPTLIALVTAGTRDYFPGHHDDVYAKSQGALGPYPNTGFYCGFMDRIATEWAQFKGVVIKRDLQMFTPAEIGKTLHSRGRVCAQRREDGYGVADLQIEVLAAAMLIARANVSVRLD
jgi:acyl dehydratase